MYNNGTSQSTGTFTNLRRDDSVNSFTAGALFKVSKDVSLFARANAGHTFIYFDDMRNAGSEAALTSDFKWSSPINL